MYKNIVVPLALGHGLSEQTLAIARTLKAPDGKITALHSFEVPQGSISIYVDDKIIENGFKQAEALLKEKTAPHDDVTPKIMRGQAYRAIVDYAKTHGCDCIVIGSHKPGLSDYYLGSTAARVVRHAPCAVHVHRN